MLLLFVIVVVALSLLAASTRKREENNTCGWVENQIGRDRIERQAVRIRDGNLSKFRMSMYQGSGC
jgi:hypothetical protein